MLRGNHVHVGPLLNERKVSFELFPYVQHVQSESIQNVREVKDVVRMK
jgi:hypothetical protein